MRFKIIYSDPCWDYDNNLSGRTDLGAKPYNTLRLDELKSLSIHEISENDSLLFQWATLPKLKESISVMESWGFKFVTVPFVWLKLNPKGAVKEIPVQGKQLPDILLSGGVYSGLGHYTNGNCEIVLMGKKGKGCSRINKSVKQVILYPVDDNEFSSEIIIAPRSRHSAKPKEIRQRIIDLFGNVSRVEIFARGIHKIEDGWIRVGNELEDTKGMDIRQALLEIKSGTYL